MTEPRPRSRGDRAVDGGLTLLMAVVVLSLVWTDSGPGDRFAGPMWVTAWLPLLYAAPLWWRRTRPVTSAGLIALGVALQALASLDSAEGLATILAFTLPSYAVAAYADTRRSAVAGLGVLAVAFAVYTACDAQVRAGAESDLWAAGFFALLVLAAWLVGSWVRNRRDTIVAAEQLARANRLVDIAVAEERSRVARDLHDVVSHGLGAVVVQAAGARAAHAAGSADLDVTLERIEEQSRQALTEMRQLLGVLRSPDEPAGIAPAPELADLSALVGRARTAGLDVSLQLDVDPHRAPHLIARSAYRIVQEGLTNVLKHAPSAKVVVTIAETAEALTISVVDDGSAATIDGAGYGLVGMRERVSLMGGSLYAGPGDGGGFEIRALIPWDKT